MRPSDKKLTNVDGNTTSFAKDGINPNERRLVEQHVDPFSKNSKLKIRGQPDDEVLLTTDQHFRPYKANEDGLLFRKYFGETDNIKYYQSVPCNQLINEVLRSLHGESEKHPGITKTLIAFRKN